MSTLKIGGVVFLAASLCCLGSCSKTGPVGPQGIPGADGSTIYNGNGMPSADVGNDGDYYIDAVAGNLYGPKTDAGWGDPLSLIGAQGKTGVKGDKGDKGDPGADGSRILSGASVPSSSVGNIGDYYWNASGYLLYGPKSASGWGNGVVLRGPKGDKGDKGDPGAVNVMYSEWLTFKWSKSYATEDIMNVHEPKITLDFIRGGGTILSYLLVIQTWGSDTVLATMHALPGSIRGIDIGFGQSTDRFNFDIGYDAIASNISLDATGEATLGASFLQDFLYIPDPIRPAYNRYRFRYILIPGGTHLRRSSPPPDPEDYKATCAYYDIPE
jgi:hypothetical protein